MEDVIMKDYPRDDRRTARVAAKRPGDGFNPYGSGPDPIGPRDTGRTADSSGPVH
jgi:hypothetical protein